MCIRDRADDDKIKVGGGTDLEIFHDGTDSHIDNNNGDLYLTTTGSGDDVHIRAVDDVQIKVQGNENAVICSGNGSVDLYYDGTMRAQTVSDGFAISGDSTLYIGAAGDLRLLHNGTNSHIWSQTGELDIRSDDFHLRNSANNENMITADANGSVELYYDNVKQIHTVANGVKLEDSKRVTFGSDSDAYILHDNQHMYIQNFKNNTYIQAPNMVALSSTDTNGSNQEHGVKYIRNGAVELYHDNAKKLETSSSGCTLQGTLTTQGTGYGSGSSNLEIQPYGQRGYINWTGTENFYFRTGSSYATRWIIDGNGHFKPGSDNTYDLGSTSLRWRNIYTNDLNLSNKGSQNDVDGTWGDFTIQEGESDLFLINKRSGKKFKFMLQEVS